jgi:serine/threonine protein kinase/tetratricopeptide (TPR) repeat protein
VEAKSGQGHARYRLLEKIGEGGMGVVYRAEDLRLRRRIALKFLPEPFSKDAEHRGRFLREARTAAALNHPSICTIHEVGEVLPGEDLRVSVEDPPIPAGTPFIAMELIQGRTLTALLKERDTLPVRELLDTFVQVADALAEAHSHRIVHRDLKPHNLMVTPAGRVKILDFGLAKPGTPVALNEEETSDKETIIADLTGEGRILGTIAYMSPEQAAGRTVTTASDIFSLGTIMYEAATGRRPFQGDTAAVSMARIIETEPEPLAGLDPSLPAGLGRIILRCHRKDPGERYADTRDLVLALKDLRDTVCLESTRAGRSPSRLPAIAVSLVILLVIAAGVTYWMTRQEPPGTPSLATDALTGTRHTAIAVLPFAVRGSPEFAYLGEGIINLLSTSLDGAGDLRSVDPRAIMGVVSQEGTPIPDPGAGARIAGSLGADCYILGDVVEAGGRLRISISLYDAHRGLDPTTQLSAEGHAGDLFGLVDDLTSRILAASFGGPGTRVTRIAAATTDSLPALKAYLAGEGNMRAGKLQEALDSFEEAVRLDPSFALAYYRVGIAAEWLTRAETTQRAAEEAFRLSGRLTLRDRNLLEAYLAWHSGDGEEAESRYRAIVGTYPEDVEAWFQLGEVLFHYGPPRGRSVAESVEAWEQVLKFEEDHALAMIHLSRIEALNGNHEAVSTLVERVLELNPASSRRAPVEALRVFTGGDAAERRALLRDLAAEPMLGIYQAAWEVALFAGDLEGAEEIYRLLLSPGRSAEEQIFGRGLLAHLALARGKLATARKELESGARVEPVFPLEQHALMELAPFLPGAGAGFQAIRARVEGWDAAATPPKVSPGLNVTVHDRVHPQLRLYLLGLLDAALGDLQAASSRADELDRLPGTEAATDLGRGLALGIRADVARRQGRAEEALRLLEESLRHTNYIFILSSPYFSQTRERFLRAELLESLGRFEEALKWYASFEGYSVYDLIYAAPSHLGRARILERLGSREDAAAHYARAVKLWKDCDPSLRPMMAEAEAGLARVSGGI